MLNPIHSRCKCYSIITSQKTVKLIHVYTGKNVCFFASYKDFIKGYLALTGSQKFYVGWGWLWEFGLKSLKWKGWEIFIVLNVCKKNNVSTLGQDNGYMVKYNPLPEGVPEGKAWGKGLYLTVNSESSTNKDIISF